MGVGLLALSLFFLAGPANAQEVEVAPEGDARLERLTALSTQLRSENGAEREAAYEALTTLDERMLPAVRARIARLAASRPPRNWAVDILNRFRRRGPRADEEAPPDVGRGAMEELSQSHPRADERLRVGLMAEAVLYWEALDRIGTVESRQAIFPIIGFDRGLWMPEARNWVRSRGPELMAVAITARGADNRYARRWGTWAMEELHADEPGRAIPSVDEAQLPDVLRAYATIRVQSAMRVIVSYVDSERRAVRRAARWAMERYGGNGIWILRTAYRNEVGEHPPEEWGWRRVSEALYAHADERRLASVRESLAAGIAARDQGDYDLMRERFEEVLVRAPEVEEPSPLAEGYAALGAAALASGDIEEARFGYRRALRLAPEHPQAAHWRSEMVFAEAERDAARGVWDRSVYRRVLEAESEHEGARAALAAMEAPASVDAGSNSRTRWGIAAAVLLALLGLGLLWHGPRAEIESEEAVVVDASFEFDEADATLADTLPG